MESLRGETAGDRLGINVLTGMSGNLSAWFASIGETN